MSPVWTSRPLYSPLTRDSQPPSPNLPSSISRTRTMPRQLYWMPKAISWSSICSTMSRTSTWVTIRTREECPTYSKSETDTWLLPKCNSLCRRWTWTHNKCKWWCTKWTKCNSKWGECTEECKEECRDKWGKCHNRWWEWWIQIWEVKTESCIKSKIGTTSLKISDKTQNNKFLRRNHGPQNC